jgi:hypothetical protein
MDASWAMSQISGAPCNEACVWGTFQMRWVCVGGSAGSDCREFEGGHCSFQNCEEFAVLISGGTLQRLALCPQAVATLRAYAESNGEAHIINSAFAVGLVVANQ